MTDFGAAMRAHLEQVERHNTAVLGTVAERMLAAARGGSVLHTCGTGHSVALVLESFYRAGGLACVNPVFHPGLLPLHGGIASSLLERTSGLAELLVRTAAPQAGDLAFVFSNSGVNPVPVELARHFREAGVPVIAVSSVAHMRAARARAGVKLGDVADHVIDTLVPTGDAAYHRDGIVTCPLSSLTSAFVWNLLLARLADLAAAAGASLPLWRSANTEGGDDHNRALAARYRSRIRAV